MNYFFDLDQFDMQSYLSCGLLVNRNKEASMRLFFYNQIFVVSQFLALFRHYNSKLDTKKTFTNN